MLSREFKSAAKPHPRCLLLLVLATVLYNGCATVADGSAAVENPSSQTHPEISPSREGPKRVLLLFGEDQQFPVTNTLGLSIRAALTSSSATRIEFYTEYLDRTRIDDALYEREMVNFWHKKYKDRKIDLIIVCYASALDLLSKHHADFLPGTPTVFCVIFEQELTKIALAPNVTGVWSAPAFRPTLDLALRLQPDTQRVIVVFGSSVFEQGLLEICKAELRGYSGNVEIEYLTDLTIGEFQQRLASLPKQTIVLYGTLAVDRSGAVFTGPESLARLSPSSAAPIYGVASVHMGSGMVGGSLVNFDYLGASAGEIGARLLAGEKQQNIPPHSVPNAVMFDWRQLHRWGIQESHVPPNSQVLFKKYSFLEQYRMRIAVAGTVLIAEALLIVGLLINRSRRLKAEKENEGLADLAQQERKRLEEVVSNVPGIVWESRGELGSSRAIKFVSEYVEKMMGYRVDEWSSTPDFWLSLIPEEDREKVVGDVQKVLNSGKQGVVQFRWTAKDGRLLWAETHLAPIFDERGVICGVRGVTLDATERNRAEEGLRESEKKTRGILRAIPDSMFLHTPEGVYLDYHAGELSDLLAPPEAFLGKHISDVLPPNLADEFSGLFRRAQATGETQVFEYQLPILGEKRWFESRIVYDGTNILSIVRNITEQRRIEDALSQHRMQLAGIIDSAMDAIVSIDDAQLIVLFNAAAEQMFGCDSGEAIGQPIERFIPARFREAHEKGLRDFGSNKGANRIMGSRGDLYGRRANGLEFPIEASVSQLELNGRKFHTAILRDITDRIRSEEAIKESEANYRSIFNAVNDAIFVHDIETGEVVDVNQVMCDMYGVDRDEAKKLGPEILSSNEPPYTRETALAWIRKAVKGDPQVFEWRAKDKLGRLFWVEVSLNRSVIGGKDRVLALVRDITYRKQSDDALRESEERFRTMADTAPVMIWISDTDNRCIYVNERWLEFTGRTLEAELGSGWIDSIHPQDLQGCLEAYKRSLNSHEPFTIEYRLRRADGEFRWIYDSGTPRYSHNGKFLGYIGSCIDITERKAIEEAQANLSGQLIRAREDECARIARELHDDLNQRMALVSIELEQLGQDPPNTLEELHMKLTKAVSQIKETSREIHRMSYDLHPSKLVHLGLVAALKSLCEELHERHGLSIEFNYENIPGDLSQDVSLCLYRIVQECLSNVVRHSSAHEAKVGLRGTGNEILLRVSDSGIGFDAESPGARKGLGLVSMRERLRLLGGRISIESRPSQGTDIDATVPLARILPNAEDGSSDQGTRAVGG